MAVYNITADIWFHQDSDPGAGPEPYGWIRAYLPEESREHYKIIWEKSKTNETFTHKKITFEITAPQSLKALCFYGDVKDWDNNSDDVLASPEVVGIGAPTQLIRLQGDRYDTYIDIKYEINYVYDSRNRDNSNYEEGIKELYDYSSILIDDIKYLKQIICKTL
ncbi:hypothetical protein [Bacillus cereus]|uniref:hypothetical protein n=1 Tax=Bacillus cereus TaxID=1396 RepID=UPI001E597558|nr:hypothetical protein [Bacillus cereus]MCD2338397.1 hypothetical protein [Bacillus cereus]